MTIEVLKDFKVKEKERRETERGSVLELQHHPHMDRTVRARVAVVLLQTTFARSDGTRLTADYYISAVPVDIMKMLLPPVWQKMLMPSPGAMDPIARAPATYWFTDAASTWSDSWASLRQLSKSSTDSLRLPRSGCD